MLFRTDVEKRLILREPYMLRRYENRLLKIVLVPNRQQVIGSWSKMYSSKVKNLYS